MFKKNVNTTVECKPDRNRPADLICNRCRNKEELVRSGEYMPMKLKTCEMSQFGGKAVVECESNRNQTVDLTWNRKPDSNQTADLTRNRKPGDSKPRVSRTVHFQLQRCENHDREPFESVVLGNHNHMYRTKNVYRDEPWVFPL